MNHIEYTQSIPVAKEHDVAVAGGGLGGVAAALASARGVDPKQVPAKDIQDIIR